MDPQTAARPNGGVGSYGRRAYYVPAEEYAPYRSRGAYGPGRKPRKAYKVKAKRNSPAMRKAMNRFKKAAKSCSKKAAKKGARKGAFQSCMQVQLKKSKR